MMAHEWMAMKTNHGPDQPGRAAGSGIALRLRNRVCNTHGNKDAPGVAKVNTLLKSKPRRRAMT